MIYDIIIIGGGPAGYTAALYGARAGLSVLVLEKLFTGGQMAQTMQIDNYPGFDEGIDGFTLGTKMQAAAEKFGAQTINADVDSVDLSGQIKILSTSSGELKAKTVIIASGAAPRNLELANEKEFTGKGVHYCAACDGMFYRDKTVVVVGGGNTAVSDALMLSRVAKKVYLVHRRDTLRATKIYHKQLEDASNVEFIWNSVISKLNGAGRLETIEVTNLKSGDITVLDADGIFVSVGRKPETDFLNGAVELDKSGYIVADESTRTNLSGVFAAGDVRTKTLRQVITAASDGAVAAHSAEEYIAQME